jgi:hypothetical protein
MIEVTGDAVAGRGRLAEVIALRGGIAHSSTLEGTLRHGPAWEGLRELDFPQRFPWTSQLGQAPLRQKEKAPFSRAFGKPSDGLEPSTPSAI